MNDHSYQELQKVQFDTIELKFEQGVKPIFVSERVENYITDDRRCLVTAAYTPSEINQEIETRLVKPLKEIDPNHYFLFDGTLHLSLLILAYNTDPPSFNDTDVEKIQKVLAETLPTCPKISYELNGLLIGPNSLAIKCFTGPELRETVHALQKKLLPLGYDTSIGLASNEIFFGNVTFCRFTHKPSQEFLAKARELKTEFIGRFTPNQFSLISSNSVFHPTKTQLHGIFPIGGGI